MGTGNKLFDQVYSELGQDFRKLIEQTVQPWEKLGIGTTDEDMLDDTEIQQYLGETGAPICVDAKGKLYLGKVTEPCTGAGCRITSTCPIGSKVGSFHTHPLVGVWPSGADIDTSAREKEIVFCIGGRMKDDKPYAACYIPTGRQFFANPFAPMYSFSEAPGGNIRFYRETPAPTYEDILEIMSDSELASEYRNDFDFEGSPEEIGAQIRASIQESGELPESFWEFYESDGEMDDLDVYTPDQAEKLMQEAFDRLKLFFQTEGRYL